MEDPSERAARLVFERTTKGNTRALSWADHRADPGIWAYWRNIGVKLWTHALGRMQDPDAARAYLLERVRPTYDRARNVLTYIPEPTERPN